ncbi:MAG: ATP-binding protein [Candidatus Neomarinimicrobiota bacterium]
MARADLLIDLIKHGISGDTLRVAKVAEAIAAEERNKNHKVFANKIEKTLSIQRNRSSDVKHNISNVSSQRIDNLFYEVVPQKQLNDLILPNDVREICDEFVEEQHRADLLRSYNLEPRNRLLFIGPPGNGKTTLAEAIAEALMVPLYVVRYDGIVGAYLGETAIRLRKLIEFVSSRKCILFFDEFETLGKERGDTHETGEIKRVVSSLLMQIDTLPSHVIVVGATNHPELLDKAVWRRFQIRVNLPKPTRTNIEKLLKKYMEKSDIDFGYSPTTLAKKQYGQSYAEIEEFYISILRKYILGLPDANMKTIVNKILSTWTARSVVLNKELKEEE